jgi:hypothetical protein
MTARWRYWQGWRVVAMGCALAVGVAAQTDSGIRPWTENPSYWQYKGKPVLLVGGSDDDNLFQWPAEELRKQLDLMRSVGGNYVRNTMSDRQDRKWELYPFLKLENGKYDLNRWNAEYWERFERFLQGTAERDIFVQIEVWDRFDYSQGNWPAHPYNPKNNVTYSEQESGLAAEYPEHPGRNKQPFFFTTPQQKNNAAVLRIQQRFVDKLLSYSLRYGHVLYCMDNETSGEEAWGKYWAEYIRAAAKKAGRRVYLTEMWDAWDLQAPQHRRTFDHPELYEFVDISQNNHNSGEKHWGNALWVRQFLSARPRPMNTVKTYGADRNKFGHSDQDGVERLWRHVLIGVAGVRFHRPDAGLGLNEKAQAAIRSVRLMEGLVKPWELTPVAEPLRGSDGALGYAAQVAGGRGWVVYLPKGGSVQLDTAPAGGTGYTVRWIDVDVGKMGSSSSGVSGVTLTAPSAVVGNFVGIVLPTRQR